MIHNETVLAIIPARGGSKGLPGKHNRDLNGKPLIAWTIETALQSAYLDRVILSSDCESIIRTARSYGCEVPYVRDPILAQDETPMMDVIFDAIDRCPGYEWTVLLQPTSPLRLVSDIDNALQQCVHYKAPACVSVCAAQEKPHWMYTISDEQKMHPLFAEHARATRRQDLPIYYSLNGALYIAKTEWLLRSRDFLGSDTIAYIMPVERSIDIDTARDFFYLQATLNYCT